MKAPTRVWSIFSWVSNRTFWKACSGVMLPSPLSGDMMMMRTKPVNEAPRLPPSCKARTHADGGGDAWKEGSSLVLASSFDTN